MYQHTTQYDGEVSTLDGIKRANSAAGFCYFEPDTMRFFSSRVSENVYPAACVVYLVTSEKQRGARRLYSVRAFNRETGSIDTVDSFQAHATAARAHARAKYCASLNNMRAV